jgi:acyl-CoA dehydrogenase
MEILKPPGASRRGLVERAQRVAIEVAGPAADSVDREARFPAEAIEALRKEKLLSALVPRELGGEEASVAELSAMCFALGQRCASAAMVYAMHTIQVACIVRHGSAAPFFRRYMAEALVEKQELLASATTELGVGGDVRTSLCP